MKFIMKPLFWGVISLLLKKRVFDPFIAIFDLGWPPMTLTKRTLPMTHKFFWYHIGSSSPAFIEFPALRLCVPGISVPGHRILLDSCPVPIPAQHCQRKLQQFNCYQKWWMRHHLLMMTQSLSCVMTRSFAGQNDTSLKNKYSK